MGKAGVFHVLWTITAVFYVTSSYIILCLHTGTQFCQHRKINLELLVEPATNCPFVRFLVAVNDKKKEKKIRFKAKELSEERSCGQEIHCYEETWGRLLV